MGVGVGTLADQYLSRDFPILHAYDHQLVIGRFAWDPSQPEQTTNRVIVGPDPSNAPFLRVARCCFHHQATFKIRTGGEWVTVGQSGLGLLHHVVTDPSTSACVLSCDPSLTLLNARAIEQPLFSGAGADGGTACTTPATLPLVDRNSAAAMRNPMFSFTMAAPCAAPAPGSHTVSTRDMQWQFQMRGGFTPISISLTGGTTAAVSPQSMRFVEPFGQLAVVDGAQQGLVLIDLNTLGFAHTPYF